MPRVHTAHGLTPVTHGRATPLPDSPAARAVAEWRCQLVADLGDDLSAQRLTLVELACRQRWILDQIDSWLWAQPSMVNRRKRVLLPIVRERQTVSDSLARLLTQLGLERVPPEADDLRSYLDTMGGEPRS